MPESPPSLKHWRRTLALRITGTLIAKLLALALLWFLFFRAGHA
jgi:hypothetical protein